MRISGTKVSQLDLSVRIIVNEVGLRPDYRNLGFSILGSAVGLATPRAGIGKAALSLEGFTQIRYLQGHMSGWYKAELPVERSPQ